ncbi:cytochrome b/b6 domain-containing protein [Aquisediminimonas sediminicola]|uniref:cytochrome b/b6 domain-containing protein n=1 Tax=Alteraquisediminimonas sediminicola TaxID=2676787 RepID=UPI001C8CF8B1|nr:cytochrome b/b6 domain-containing protein [Aquisediminimonas sediminicola]
MKEQGFSMAQQIDNIPRRWDPIVKLTHWGIVAAIIGNALVTEEGSGWHIWVGYSLAALLALRLLWGLIGPSEARFSAFPPSPSRALMHISEIRRGEVARHKSHNPLGALMVYAIWAMLGIIIASGIALSGPPPADPSANHAQHEGEAQLAGTIALGEHREVERDDETTEDRAHEIAGEADEGEENILVEVHEVAVNLLYLLIALHLAGVVFETHRSGRETIAAMIPRWNRTRP